MTEPLSRYEYQFVDFSSPSSLLNHAKKLEGHTFREVLDLGITPEGEVAEEGYNKKSFKGGMGNLIEERYFGYRANSDAHADFIDAGVELKTSCFDTKADGTVRAGERLVLGMIQYDESIESPLEDSHMWEKGSQILLIYYGRDRSIDKYDQTITYVVLFTPPEEDLAIIREDYKTIQSYVTAGKADELSESLTRYLGACTKGANAEKGVRDQSVYAPGKEAKSRAWCYKGSYMNSVLNEYIIGDKGGESIVKDASQLCGTTFDEYVLSLLKPYIGKTDREICEEFGIPYKNNKAQWVTITYRILGLLSDSAIEFEKANVSVRTVRIEENGSVKESLSLNTFSFADLAQEEWEDAPLHDYFDETRFLFVAFQKNGGETRLRGAMFWSMPVSDINGPLKKCWESARERARFGVKLTKHFDKKGELEIRNNLPKASENLVAHVRPHTSKRAYKLADGTVLGNVNRDGDQLPDGQWMTKQSFWLNAKYIARIVAEI